MYETSSMQNLELFATTFACEAVKSTTADLELQAFALCEEVLYQSLRNHFYFQNYTHFVPFDRPFLRSSRPSIPTCTA